MRRRNNHLLYAGFILILALTVVLSYIRYGMIEDNETETVEQENISETVQKETMSVDALNEDTSVYAQDDPKSVVCFYVTVEKGDQGSDTDHTFNEVNNAVRFMNDSHYINDVYARALVQVGDENGPVMGMLGYGVEKTNARIRIRGNSSSTMPQKSYKLDLDDEAGLWRGQSNIALNKSIFDVTRLKNKVYFDLLKDIPDVPSIRTQFVHLYIKDTTSGETTFKDYGFYTQAEVPSKKYLGNHGLDKNGYLYKAISFNFEPSESLKNFDDPQFDQNAFDQILSCKGRQDNQKLIDLVNMINDRSIDINDIIGTYIDRDNYITWLAYNILMANIDTTMQNFYLYSPLNSEKWYFIPWDGDNSLHVNEDIMEGLDKSQGNYEHGISNYWGVILHQRFLKVEANRKELLDKVNELHETVNAQSVQAMFDQYNSVVEPYVMSMPDINQLGHTKAERDQILQGLGQEVEDAYQAFIASLDELMPFYEYEPETAGGTTILSWEHAYSFDNEDIQYHVLVSRYPDMREPVVDQMTPDNTLNCQLEAGTYYMRVNAATQSGKQAQAMNKINVNDVYYPGVLSFTVHGG